MAREILKRFFKQDGSFSGREMVAYIDTNGEVKIMMYYRFVWEESNGPIPKGHVIHHIDGNFRNNEIENLRCMSRGEHSVLHMKNKTYSERFGNDKAEKVKKKISIKMAGVNKGKEYRETGSRSEAQKKAWEEGGEDRRARASQNNSGDGNPMAGKTHTKEARAKISAGNKGKVVSEETRRKLSERAKGRKFGPMSEEEKKKRSEAAKRYLERKRAEQG